MSNEQKLNALEIGSQVKVGTVEGATSKKGTKQNKTYTITGGSSMNEDGTPSAIDCTRRGWFMSDETGHLFEMRIGLNDTVGIAKNTRFSYFTEIEIF